MIARVQAKRKGMVASNGGREDKLGLESNLDFSSGLMFGLGG